VDTSLGKLLIVEDDTALRKSVKTSLSVLGFYVDEAGTGEEALMMVRVAPFEAVLLDINMPDGYAKHSLVSQSSCSP
jgi:two-component system KDP operon response regulator KdpE